LTTEGITVIIVDISYHILRLFSREASEIITIFVDRIEGDCVVCLDEEDRALSLPLSFFSERPKDGDVFTLTLTPDPAKKAERQKEITSLFERLKKKKGDSMK
jgi:hypothetical protein